MRKFMNNISQQESVSGLLLFIATILALIWANLPFSSLYEQFVSNWVFMINEGLMAIFFLLVGLELKRGFHEGHFSKTADIVLPFAAACGGMIMPAIIYLILNFQHPETVVGFATPVATDIAFALGALSLFGKAIPRQLKLFLLTVAIFDDLGAILIIAVFYSHGLSLIYLSGAIFVILSLMFCNFCRIHYLLVYLIGGVALWYLFLKAGIHPTVAGMVTALTMPNAKVRGKNILPEFEKHLRPYVVFIITPIFALANAGLPLADVNLATFKSNVVLGIICGLFFGKQIGVMLVTWLATTLSREARLPQHTSWLAFYGVALLCGIGFTMSLFLGTLSFQNHPQYINEVRLGVLAGSILSGIAGASVLAFAARRNRRLSHS